MKIAVLVCNNNYNKYLVSLFKSLENQIFKNFVVYLGDYGDTENSANLLKNFSFPHYYFKINTDNLQIARNFLYDNSHSDLICYPDADSILEPDFLSELYKYLDNNIAFTYCDFWYIRNGKKLLCQTQEFNIHNIEKSCINPILLKRQYFPYYDPEFEKLQDRDLWLNIYRKFKGVGKRVPKPLFTHIQKEGESLSWNLISKHTYYVRKLKQKYKDLIK